MRMFSSMSKTLLASRISAVSFLAVDTVERVETVRTPRCTSGSGARAGDRATVHEVRWIVTFGFRAICDDPRPGFAAKVRTFPNRKAAMAHYGE